MNTEDSPEVKVLVVEQDSESNNDRESSGKFPTLTGADWEIILRGFSQIGMKEYKINFIEVTDQELIKELLSHYLEAKKLLSTKVVDDKPRVLIIGSGHLQNELRGRLASACAIDSENFSRSDVVEEIGAFNTISTQEKLMLEKAFNTVFGIRDRESIINLDMVCHPVIEDNTFYPKKSPNSYSEVQKQQSFFRRKRRK
jgi:hypothetical protein